MDVAERIRTTSSASELSGDAGRLATLSPAGSRHGRERMILNLFFEERDDRWFPGDRHVRPWLRRLLYGKARMSGQHRVFLNLCAGLDRLGIRYRVNDYGHIQKHPEELACIIGRPFVLDWISWKNPILLGVAAFNHPIDAPDLFQRLPVRTVLVPSTWYADMCRPGWPKIEVWPIGIDTDAWKPSSPEQKTTDVLLYDKVQWQRERHSVELVAQIRSHLAANGHSVEELRYGSYEESDYRRALSRCRAMIFLCQHESQGIAYQEALASGVPVFAWDGGGAWQDPDYFPHRVTFEGVSSVPYFDARCGMKFIDADSFKSSWSAFWERAAADGFSPRDYVMDNLALEQQALRYYEIAESLVQQRPNS